MGLCSAQKRANVSYWHQFFHIFLQSPFHSSPILRHRSYLLHSPGMCGSAGHSQRVAQKPRSSPLSEESNRLSGHFLRVFCGRTQARLGRAWHNALPESEGRSERIAKDVTLFRFSYYPENRRVTKNEKRVTNQLSSAYDTRRSIETELGILA